MTARYGDSGVSFISSYLTRQNCHLQ